MKILAFSDLHRDVDAAELILAAGHDADILVGAGDFATQSRGALETLEILDRSEKPVVLVHGNHDEPGEIAGFCQASKQLNYVHGLSISFGGHSFFGLGGEIPSRNTFPWNAAETEEQAATLLADCPQGAILVTHTPPYGLADLQKDGSHEGSSAILDCVKMTSPQLVLCGHIHNAWGMRAQHGTTLVQNLGPRLNWFDI